MEMYKIPVSEAAEGDNGQRLLVEGKDAAMRFWSLSETTDNAMHKHEYETLGYVLKGEAKLHLGDDTLTLHPGDSWIVPSNIPHRYEVHGPFEAVEVTTPAARREN